MGISKNAVISKTVIIHENVNIEDDVVIHDYVVIYPNTTIKKGTEIFDHVVLGKPPRAAGGNSRKINENLGELIIGENCVFSPGVVIYSGVTIGNNNLFGDNASIREECVIGDYNLISRCVTFNYNSKVGNRVKIMDLTHITGNVVIEDDVFISTLVATTNDNAIGKEGYSDAHVKGPTIRKNASIGAGANLLPNVEIGEGAVVGAGSVVTKDVAPYTLVMGIPAKKIRDL